MSEFHKVARKHFPLRPFEGDGAFILYSECDHTLPVLFFDLLIFRAGAAGEWANNGCGAEKCRGRQHHIEKRIVVAGPVPVGPPPIRESYVWERD